MRNSTRIVAVAVLIAITGLLNAENARFISPLPFNVGEHGIFRATVFNIHVANLDFSVDDFTLFQGQLAIVTTLKLDTTEFISSIYKIHNKETTFSLPGSFESLYCEKYIDEANLFDLVQCTFPTNQDPSQYRVNCVSKTSNVKSFTIVTNSVLRNFPDLILWIRALDHDYYIRENKSVSVTFFDGLLRIVPFTFKPVLEKIDYRGKKVEVYAVRESSGKGMIYYLLKDRWRTPVQMIVPAFSILGIGTINISGDLIEYTPGKTEIRPE